MLVLKKNSVVKIAINARSENKTIVFTNGCFDLIHKGHLHLLEAASREGDLLIVAVNSDKSVQRLKGKGRPIQTERKRVEALIKLEVVDIVTIFNQDTPFEIIRLVQPDILVKGGDYDIRKIVGADFVKQKGGRVVKVPILHGFSTTSTIKKKLVNKTRT